MPKEVKAQYSTVQIKSFLDRRLRPRRMVFVIPKRVSMRFRLQSVFMGLRAGRATARAYSIKRDSQWVIVKIFLRRGFV